MPSGPLRSTTVGTGHWEADHIVGKANLSATLHLCEKVSRYSILITMPEGYGSAAALAGLVGALKQVPPHLRQTLTFDQGTEWAQWPTLKATYDLRIWFCESHSTWQRGQERTRIVSGAGGSLVAPSSRTSTPSTPTPWLISSTTRVAGVSTTGDRLRPMLSSACGDR